MFSMLVEHHMLQYMLYMVMDYIYMFCTYCVVVFPLSLTLATCRAIFKKLQTTCSSELVGGYILTLGYMYYGFTKSKTFMYNERTFVKHLFIGLNATQQLSSVHSKTCYRLRFKRITQQFNSD